MPAKRTVYILLVMFLGALLGDIFYDALEIFYLNSSIVSGDSPYIAYARSLFSWRPWLEIFFDLMGALGGYYAGKAWWKIIYIEDRRHKKYKLGW